MSYNQEFLHSTLNAQYFTKLCSGHQDPNNSNAEYESYRTIGYPMVLRSVNDGRCLACVHAFWVGQPYLTQMKPIMTELDKPGSTSQRYQVVFPVDKIDPQVPVNKPFEFVITNLCYEGYIKFDFMHTDDQVTTVNPGGLNQVNEIRPLESYVIRADQTNGNKQIMVTIKKKLITGETVALKTELVSEDKIGDYLYLTVTPRTGTTTEYKNLQEAFADTIWTTTDHLIVKRKRQQTYHIWNDLPYRSANRPNFPALRRPNVEFESEPSLSVSTSDSYNGQFLSPMGSSSVGCFESMNPPAQTASARSMSFSQLTDKCASKSKSYRLENRREDLLESCFDSFAEPVNYTMHGGSCSYQSQSLSVGTVESVTKGPAVTKEEYKEKVLNSQVAGITHGETLVVNSNETSINYRYDLHSPKCIIGMSVVEGLNVVKPELITVAQSDVLMRDFIEQLKFIQTKKMLQEYKDTKIYESCKDCSVCLESVNPLLVLFRCGHRCVCEECSNKLNNKCPLCRGHILAMFDINSLPF